MQKPHHFNFIEKCQDCKKMTKMTKKSANGVQMVCTFLEYVYAENSLKNTTMKKQGYSYFRTSQRHIKAISKLYHSHR